jgi:hypothetical protein
MLHLMEFYSSYKVKKRAKRIVPTFTSAYGFFLYIDSLIIHERRTELMIHNGCFAL